MRREDVPQGHFKPGVQKFSSRGIEQIWEKLSNAKEKQAILDIGRACQANIQFYANFRCTVVIEDFLSEYALQKALPIPQNPKQVLYSLLEGVAQKPFDVILLWDTFNYLKPQEALVFANALTSVAAPDALMLFHVSSISDIPLAPRFYRILGKNELSEEILGKETTSCPRYSQRDLSQFLPQWRFTRSIHLRNSMQEHLLTCQVKRKDLGRTIEEALPAMCEPPKTPHPRA